MKPGRTANIRINPADCMSCIDLVQRSGMNLKGASFSVIVSAALSTALESFRQSGIIPRRDGFEYGQMMQDYPLQPKENRARSFAIGKLMHSVGSEIQFPSVVKASPDLQRKKVRCDELVFKQNNDPSNMTPEEQAELRELILDLNTV